MVLNNGLPTLDTQAPGDHGAAGLVFLSPLCCVGTSSIAALPVRASRLW